MKVYISGPMSNLPEFNYPAFHAAAKTLRAQGFEVVNPAELDDDMGKEWHHYMRNDIRALVDCEKVFVLPGWERSRGATLEVFIATQLGMTVEAMSGAELLDRVAELETENDQLRKMAGSSSGRFDSCDEATLGKRFSETLRDIVRMHNRFDLGAKRIALAAARCCSEIPGIKTLEVDASGSDLAVKVLLKNGETIHVLTPLEGARREK